jgi:hypothetical protein
VEINKWPPLGEHAKNHKMAYMENKALVYLTAKPLIIQLSHYTTEPIREVELDCAAELLGNENFSF